MDRATLQLVASHCPHLEYLGCSTLSIKESQPQIQLSSLRRLSFTFNMTSGAWEEVPVAAYAALKAPALELVTNCIWGTEYSYTNVGHPLGCYAASAQMQPKEATAVHAVPRSPAVTLRNHLATTECLGYPSLLLPSHVQVLIDPASPQDLRDAEVAATGALKATRGLFLYTAPFGSQQPSPTPAYQTSASWQSSSGTGTSLLFKGWELEEDTLKNLPPFVTEVEPR
jgi:hypothetical protein